MQLFLLHLRSNFLLLVNWVLLAFFATGVIGKRFGMQYLFLDPEYLGQINFFSFAAVGMAFGGYFMSWNLTTYLLHSQYFPFLASLSRPYTKFTFNNLVLPVIFILGYTTLISFFQLKYQGQSFGRVMSYLAGFYVGFGTLIALFAAYLQLTNRDIRFYRARLDRELPPNLRAARFAPGHRGVDLEEIVRDENPFRVETYLGENLRPRLVRSIAHYDRDILRSIFRQNHLNALLIQLIALLLLLLLGYLIEYSIFRIPAAASIFIFFTLITTIVGAITYWFNRWRMFIFIGLTIGVNYLTSFDQLQRENKAYGLDYDRPAVTYDYEKLEEHCLSDQVTQDKLATYEILDRWRIKQGRGEEKPPLVLLSVSGGGLRAAVWAIRVLQQADSVLGHSLLDHTALITGASGGMIGTSYYREAYLRDTTAAPLIDNISQDLLNPIAFTIVSNDIFLPWTTFRYAGQTYYRDRAYSFEQQLAENTRGWLDKPLSAYREPERQAEIPLMFLTPSIINDGRRLTISPQGVSYMMVAPAGTRRPRALEVDAVDFGWLFQDHQADSLRFLSAIRMNATYPYILPLVHLPTTPRLEIVDAGWRDNYGILSTSRFLQVFRNWILENTSRVILVQINSFEKIEQIGDLANQGLVQTLVNPLGLAGKMLSVQELEHDNSLGFIYDLLGPEHFEIVRFIYRPDRENPLAATISFHMTQYERRDILDAVHTEENQRNFARLRALLE
jgi:hypothetical protein